MVSLHKIIDKIFEIHPSFIDQILYVTERNSSTVRELIEERLGTRKNSLATRILRDVNIHIDTKILKYV